MACTRPIRAYRALDNKEKNKYKISFVKSEGYKDVQIDIPCGKCIECRRDKARQWAGRIKNEADCWENNCFLTLTYDNENIPINDKHKKFTKGKNVLRGLIYSEKINTLKPTLYKRDVQLFLKKLRKKLEPRKIRFYLCGEYGDNYSRPHYHLCVFNYDFPDREQLGLSNAYRSELLESCWPHGYSSIQALNYDSGAYVAKYVTKKITGNREFQYEGKVYQDADDYYNGRQEEFATMSRKPGIGAKWYDKYKDDLYRTNKLEIKRGVAIPIPRFYNNRIKEEFPERYKKLKLERRLKADKLDIHERAYLDRVREIQHKQSIKTRRLEK